MSTAVTQSPGRMPRFHHDTEPGWVVADGSARRLTKSRRMRREDAVFQGRKSDVLGRRPVTILKGEDGLTLHYTRNGWWDASERERVLYNRDVHGLFYDGATPVGTIKLTEWRADPGLSDYDFWDWMDSNTSEAGRMAKAIIAAWDPVEILMEGTIVGLDRLWLRPCAARGSKWAPLANSLIERLWGDGRAAMLMLQPFPLEYEADNRPAKAAVKRRILAMKRLYGRTLGVQSLPTGDWMWRPMIPNLPLPRRRRTQVG